MKTASTVREYYLQVLKAGEYPKWPRPEDELVINHRPLGSGWVQCWAYLKEENTNPRAIPPAEILAQRFPESNTLIVIDQLSENLLELVLVKDRHAFAHTFTSRDNLEDNIESIADFAKKKFDIKVEQFMSTGNVDPDIEKRLDTIEKDGEESPEETENLKMENKSQPLRVEEQNTEDQDISPREAGGPSLNPSFDDDRPDLPESSWEIKKVRTPYLNPFPGAGSFKKPTNEQERPRNLHGSSSGSSSKFSTFLPILILLVIFGGLIANREVISGKITSNFAPTPTPTQVPTPTPTPTPTPVERKQYKLRVLNGTSKTGAAATLATKLKDLGWQVTETGNNKVKGIEQTLVTTKTDFDPALKTLLDDLSGQYEASTSATLKSSEKVDAEVVIGNR